MPWPAQLKDNPHSNLSQRLTPPLELIRTGLGKGKEAMAGSTRGATRAPSMISLTRKVATLTCGLQKFVDHETSNFAQSSMQSNFTQDRYTECFRKSNLPLQAYSSSSSCALPAQILEYLFDTNIPTESLPKLVNSN